MNLINNALNYIFLGNLVKITDYNYNFNNEKQLKISEIENRRKQYESNCKERSVVISKIEEFTKKIKKINV